MNPGNYNLKEFLTNRKLTQIIIPEIQRDYVWQTENVKKFLLTILENSKRQKDFSQEEEEINDLTPALRDELLRARAQKKNQNYCNIGFIYAYYDREIDDRLILIDGQQRMTTLFLILLALSVKEKKQDNFISNYYKSKKILKIDYKVRDDAHEFLLKFVDYILEEKNIEDISKEYWNFTVYKNDLTIKSIIENYKVIKDFIGEKDISLDYVENYIEFWYFDTDKSEQGEELYLYMNSRGETVRPNESIKAELLKEQTNTDKHKWGKRWEDWQKLFWKYRKGNPNTDIGKENLNADKGIEEFLKWIKFIEKIKSKKNEMSREKLAIEIKEINDAKKISSDGLLELNKIENYYIALEKIILYKKELDFNMDLLTGNIKTIKEYIKLIPVLMYAEKYPDFNNIDIKRFSRFFMNITRFDTIEKGTTNSLGDVILLADNFLENNFKDITDIVIFADKFKSILTEEEKDKLSIYRQSSVDLRKEIEKAFWAAEDYEFCDGKIWLIWDCIDFNRLDLSAFDINKLSDFKDCFENFKTLFNIENIFDNRMDLVRRALLTKGDYLIWDGYSHFIAQYGYSNYTPQNRYSFLYEKEQWRKQLTSNEKIKTYKSLIKDFGNRKKADNSLKTDDILNNIITEFINAKTEKEEKDWIYYFVKYPDLLAWCEEKRICGKDTGDIGKINLLKTRKVHNESYYFSLEEKLKILKAL